MPTWAGWRRLRGASAWRSRIAHPGTRVLFVDERGRASPCSFTSDGYGIPIAEIDSPQALRAVPDRFAARRRAERLAPCADCQATHVVDKFEAPEVVPIGLGPVTSAAGRGS